MPSILQLPALSFLLPIAAICKWRAVLRELWKGVEGCGQSRKLGNGGF
jgi:hypothetical protein